MIATIPAKDGAFRSECHGRARISPNRVATTAKGSREPIKASTNIIIKGFYQFLGRKQASPRNRRFVIFPKIVLAFLHKNAGDVKKDWTVPNILVIFMLGRDDKLGFPAPNFPAKLTDKG